MFSWLFRKKEKARIEPDVDLFYGHNLEEWNYVGYTTIYYSYDDGKSKVTADIFFFCDKEDINVRSYYVNEKRRIYDSFFDHPWLKNAELWSVCEREIYDLKFDEPSKWMRDYMLKEYKSAWNKETQWWDITDKSKYEAAKKQQEEKPKIKDDDPTDNVVPVDFTK